MVRLRYAALATLLLALCAFSAAACGDDSRGVTDAVGATCDRDSHCEDRCITDWPGGFCTLDCRSHDACPDDAWCVDTKGGICLFRCETSGECRERLGDDYACKREDDFTDRGRYVCKKD